MAAVVVDMEQRQGQQQQRDQAKGQACHWVGGAGGGLEILVRTMQLKVHGLALSAELR